MPTVHQKPSAHGFSCIKLSMTSFKAMFGMSWSCVKSRRVIGSKCPTLYKSTQTASLYNAHQPDYYSWAKSATESPLNNSTITWQSKEKIIFHQVVIHLLYCSCTLFTVQDATNSMTCNKYFFVQCTSLQCVELQDQHNNLQKCTFEHRHNLK